MPKFLCEFDAKKVWLSIKGSRDLVLYQQNMNLRYRLKKGDKCLINGKMKARGWESCDHTNINTPDVVFLLFPIMRPKNKKGSDTMSWTLLSLQLWPLTSYYCTRDQRIGEFVLSSPSVSFTKTERYRPLVAESCRSTHSRLIQWLKGVVLPGK